MNRLKLIFIALVALMLVPTASAGTFTSSDPLLNKIWMASTQSAEDMLAPGGQTVDAEGRYCPLPAGMTVILDGVERDRCSYIGDESVIGLTFDVSHPHFDVQRDMLKLFASHQNENGAIPSSPLYGGMLLFDYSGYWVTTLYNYVLYSGDLNTARDVWGNLVSQMDRWYVANTDSRGLVVNPLGNYDYGFMRRHGDTVAYFNAQYIYVLRQAAELAGWLNQGAEQQLWLGRAQRAKDAFMSAFWDSSNGAFFDTTADHITHPQDGNSFAVLANVGTQTQSISALNYLNTHNHYTYGNSISDSTVWDDPAWGYQSNMRVYPFMSFYELLARYSVGLNDSALDLIRREWGYMVNNGPQPGRTWELIGPYGGGPTDWWPSWDAGWSSGAASILSNYVLGIKPTSPGYATFTVTPHASDLQSASGSVDTPRGAIIVSWKKVAGKINLTVSNPVGTTWTNKPVAVKPKPKKKR